MSVIGRTLRTAGRTIKGAATTTAEVPAPALAMSALGLFGLVEWPLVVAVGAGALVLQRINRTVDGSAVAAEGSGDTAGDKSAP